MTKAQNEKFKNFDPEKLYFVPLGGCGIFGANLNLYCFKGKWLMVDFGMGFADENMPGVEILLPDPSFIEERKQDLLGIIITHAHEDHIGGLEHFWHRLKCPIYATPFTASLIAKKFEDKPFKNTLKLNVVPVAGELDLDPFHLKFINVAHSIPEAQALAITVQPHGTILHTGDWKIDPEPIEGHITDEKALRALADKKPLVLIGDSTNAMVPGHSGSEETVRQNMIDLFSSYKRRIVVTCFASNVARMHSIFDAAKANGREVALVGKSLWRMDDTARHTGYLQTLPEFLTDEDAERVDPEKIVYIVTGSQGEVRAQLARIAHDEHPSVYVEEGDVVIFSSRAIPGNERAIERIKNNLYLLGADVLTDREAPIHVSGHPYREEIKLMYKWVKPKYAIPVHGEQMQLEKHADLALECGVEEVLIPQNGDVIQLAPGVPEKIGIVKSGMLALEGTRIVAVDHDAILTRKRMMFNGSAIITVVFDQKGQMLSRPKVTALGLLDEESEHDQAYLEEAANTVAEAIALIPLHERSDRKALEEVIRIAARRYFNEQFNRKPQTRVHLMIV